MSRDPSKILSAGVVGGVIGALGGAAIAASVGELGWGVGALIGAVVLAALGAWADATRVPGQPQPLFVRITMAAFIAAVFGAILEWVLPDWSAAVPCALVGAASGLMGFRTRKVLLGVVVGLAVGFAFDALWPGVGWALPSAVTLVMYRLVAAIVWRGREQVRIMGERVPQERLQYVVPFGEAS